MELKHKIIKINNVSPSFCTAKWLQTTLMLQNGYNHSCHHPAPHKIPLLEVLEDPSALHNSKHKQQQRQLMKAGIRPEECSYCWKIEDLGGDYISDRHYKTADYWSWPRFQEVVSSDPLAPINPAYLEVSFSNACNFKCSYCSPDVSSKWLEEVERWGPYPTSNRTGNVEWLKETGRYPYANRDDNPYVTAFWQWFPTIYDKLQIFRITGGEPLMSKDVWRLLDWIIENPKPDLEIAINSNLVNESQLIDKFITTLNRLSPAVKRITVFTSAESIEEAAQYSRWGMNYQEWLINVHRVLKETPAHLAIMTTMNILSAHHTIYLIDLVTSLRLEYNISPSSSRVIISFNILHWPRYLSVRLLPADIKVRIATDIMNKISSINRTMDSGADILYLEEIDQLERFIEYMNYNEDNIVLRRDFIAFIDEYDRRKNTDFKTTFPHLVDMYNDWKNNG
jgi:organic radical activating enzyme